MIFPPESLFCVCICYYASLFLWDWTDGLLRTDCPIVGQSRSVRVLFGIVLFFQCLCELFHGCEDKLYHIKRQGNSAAHWLGSFCFLKQHYKAESYTNYLCFTISSFSIHPEVNRRSTIMQNGTFSCAWFKDHQKGKDFYEPIYCWINLFFQLKRLHHI